MWERNLVILRRIESIVQLLLTIIMRQLISFWVHDEKKQACRYENTQGMLKTIEAGCRKLVTLTTFFWCRRRNIMKKSRYKRTKVKITKESVESHDHKCPEKILTEELCFIVFSSQNLSVYTYSIANYSITSA